MSPLFVPANHFRELSKAEIFPDPSRPLEVDLGCGDATFLIEMAKAHPERDFLGVERMLGRVEKTQKKIIRNGLTNVRVLRLESAYTVGWLLPTSSVSRLHLLCPDPWPKTRHHKNRLVNQEEFLNGLARILQPQGEFLLKTDHAEYFEDAVAQMLARHDFARLEWPADAFFYPQTDFEQHWLGKGLTINRGRWQLLSQTAEFKAAA